MRDRCAIASTAAVWIQEPGGGGAVFDIAGRDDARWITRMAALLQRISTTDISSDLGGRTNPLRVTLPNRSMTAAGGAALLDFGWCCELHWVGRARSGRLAGVWLVTPLNIDIGVLSVE